jgi:hypothetical protein
MKNFYWERYEEPKVSKAMPKDIYGRDVARRDVVRKQHEPHSLWRIAEVRPECLRLTPYQIQAEVGYDIFVSFVEFQKQWNKVTTFESWMKEPRTMTQMQFLEALPETRKTFDWLVQEDQITGYFKGTASVFRKCCPLTAVATITLSAWYRTNQTDLAADDLGLDIELAAEVVAASKSVDPKYGVMRRQLFKLLGLKKPQPVQTETSLVQRALGK